MQLAPPDPAERELPDGLHIAPDKRQQRPAVRWVRHFNSKELDEGGEDVDGGCECCDTFGCLAGPRDHQRNVAQGLVDRDVWLAPDVSFAKVMPVVCADDDNGVLPEVVALDRIDYAAEPGVDHRQF